MRVRQGAPDASALAGPPLDIVPLPLVELSAAERVLRMNRAAHEARVGGRLPDGTPIELMVSAAVLGKGSVLLAIRDPMSFPTLDELHVRFIDMMSHELRSFLASMMGYASLLERAELERDLPLRKRCIQMIKSKARRMTDLIEDLVCALSIHDGALEIESVEVDACEVARSSAQAATSAGGNVKVSVPERPLMVLGSRGSSPGPSSSWFPARCAGRAGGRRSRREPRAAARGAAHPHFAAAMGAFEQPSPALFGSSGDAALDTSGAKSFGVGIYIADGVVQAHGGRVEMELGPTLGSVFTVEVPPRRFLGWRRLPAILLPFRGSV